MAVRSLLHLDHLDEFRAWSEARGWKSEPCKGFYEVLRMRHASHSAPVIFYKRAEAKQHATACDGVGTQLVKAFVVRPAADRKSHQNGGSDK